MKHSTKHNYKIIYKYILNGYVGSYPVFGRCIQPALNQYCAQGWHISFVGILPVVVISTLPVVNE